jgi:hypothetical protein
MSSFYEDASLVMIPSGYKTSKVYSAKPTDGAGDLSFIRSNDTATRVGPDGLIEKVRTNTYLYSNTFTDAAWTNLRTNFTPAVSIYAKKGENEKIGFREDTDTGFYATFNLNTGVLIEKSASALASITALSGGWYRVQFAVPTSSAKLAGIYFLDNAYTSGSPSSNTYAGNGTDGLFIYAAQAETGDIATDYIATTSAAVSVGPVANLPRLDYLGSSCPRLLLEPQRTNLLTYSEHFDNAAWTLYNGTQVANTTETLDPSGYYGAEKVIMGGIDSATYRKTIGGLTNGDTYTFSLYIKQGSGVTAFLDICDASTTPDITPTSEWVRYTKTGVWNTSLNFVDIELRGTSGSFCYIWGAQLEAASYATSYIPTLGAAVTRGADLASKTGIASLIGQAEGTMYYEGVASANAEVCNLNRSTTNAVFIYTRPTGEIAAYVYADSVGLNLISAVQSSSRFKCAIAYKSNSIAFYVNGNLIAENTTATFTPNITLDRFDINYGGYVSNVNTQTLNQALLFKTRLSNDSLAALTSL